eukprot:GFYU01004661.1.p1 GENE.GFYU01004661.1~~GFYU01004661.1.p1  ORF type:complete len:463 (-),score=137.96 GFYU01004661.1:367-1755(-)
MMSARLFVVLFAALLAVALAGQTVPTNPDQLFPESEEAAPEVHAELKRETSTGTAEPAKADAGKTAAKTEPKKAAAPAAAAAPVASPGPKAAAKTEDLNPYCDVISSASVCLENGKKVVTVDAAQSGTAAHWTFDDNKGLDHSGNQNHAQIAPGVGPGFGGRGHSAKFDGKSMTTVAHTTSFDGIELSVTMWVYLLEEPQGQWRTLMHKGATATDRYPALLIEPNSRRLKFAVSVDDPANKFGEHVVSMAPFPLRRWVHVGAVRDASSMKLYINGILDNEAKANSTARSNTGPVYVGGDPFHKFGSVAFIDEVRYFARALSIDEIQAESGFALGGIDPNFIHLACAACSLDEAATKCRKTYHLCTHGELYSGGYQVARIMGWAELSQTVWSGTESRALQHKMSEASMSMSSFNSLLELDSQLEQKSLHDMRSGAKVHADGEKGTGKADAPPKVTALAMCCRD